MDVNKSSLQILPKIGRTILNQAPLDRSGVNGDLQLGRAPTRDSVVRNWPKQGPSATTKNRGQRLDVSQLPASTGTFRYSVSSEGGFDYLLFCVTTPDALDTAATATAGPAP